MAKPQRFVNTCDVLQNWLQTQEPDCTFHGETAEDFDRWKAAFGHHYRRCIGAFPERVPLNLEIVSEEDQGSYVRQKVLYDSSPGVTVPAYVLVPKDVKLAERRPAILAAHGHGHGKDDICGVTREKGEAESTGGIDQLNYEYAVGAVTHGYVVIAPDWCPFGERRPPETFIRQGRDPCNVMDMCWRYFGRPLINQNIWDGMRAVDVLTEHRHVDPDRIGVIGLSYGGTMSTHLLANDERIRVGVVSGYISTVRGDALTDRGNGNTCGAQHVPNLLLHGDIPDVLGLAVPKPVLFEMGEKETCFYYPDMKKAYDYLRTMYVAAGYEDHIDSDVHPNDHMWSGRKAWDWLQTWL